MKFTDIIRLLASKVVAVKFQLWVACGIIVISVIMTILVMLRFVPHLEKFALGRHEPFWVLLLSVLALLFSGYTALPAALAYREVKGQRDTTQE